MKQYWTHLSTVIRRPTAHLRRNPVESVPEPVIKLLSTEGVYAVTITMIKNDDCTHRTYFVKES